MIRNYKYEYETLCEDIKRGIIDNLRFYHNGFYQFTLEDRVRVPYAMGTPLISEISVIDNDLARDNLENDLPAADLEDL
jgi:hypothetical protein